MKKLLFISLLFSGVIQAQPYTCKIGLMKYRGGGDWYANLETSLPNLIQFCNNTLGTNIDPSQAIVEPDSREIFNYPFVHMTGHGNITFNENEANNLRNYLVAGGFLHIDDNYGFDPFVRRELKKVFPELEFVPLPDNHAIYHQPFAFRNGLPKIHEHDNKPAIGYGLFWNGRLVCFYSTESDLGDGWESPEVHNDNRDSREKALKMGANIVQYAFMGNDYER